MKLPGNAEVIVPEDKIIGYLLSDSHPVGKSKAYYFMALGYNKKDFVRLKKDLEAIAATNEVAEVISTPFGAKYIIDGEITGPSGTRKRLRTVWIVETGKTVPRFVTAYPGD